jgi:hypothetical protein
MTRPVRNGDSNARIFATSRNIGCYDTSVREDLRRLPRLCVAKTLSNDDFRFIRENSLFLNQNSLFCFLQAVSVSPFRSKSRLEAENAVLRHQVIVLRRKVQGRARLTNSDRRFFIRNNPAARASPWQNGFAERLIGSIRRECVDHFIVLGEAHLRRILRTYARYYNDIRTRRSLDKDTPVSRPVQRITSIKSRMILGGLLHHYVRV